MMARILPARCARQVQSRMSPRADRPKRCWRCCEKWRVAWSLKRPRRCASCALVTSQRSSEKGNDEQNQEEEEEHLRNSCRARGQTTKSKDGRHDRDHEKNGCPVKHKAPRLKKVPRRRVGRLASYNFAQVAPPNSTGRTL